MIRKYVATAAPASMEQLDPGDVPSVFGELAEELNGLVVNLPRSLEELALRDGTAAPHKFRGRERSGLLVAAELWLRDNELDARTLGALAAAVGRAGAAIVDVFEVEELVLREDGRNREDGRASSGVKMLHLGRRRPDLTREQFACHWREVHGPLALAHHPGLSRYVQDLVVGSVRCRGPETDCMASLHFATVGDFVDRLYDSEEGRLAIAQDVKRFGGGGSTHFVLEVIVSAPVADTLHKTTRYGEQRPANKQLVARATRQMIEEDDNA